MVVNPRGIQRSAKFPLQEAIFKRIETIPGLKGRVFDYVPSGTNYPYVTLGSDTAIDWSTKTIYGQELTHTINVFSQEEGFKEAKEIEDKILQVIASAFPIKIGDFFTVKYIRLDLSESFKDADGRTRHTVLRFIFLVEQKQDDELIVEQ